MQVGETVSQIKILLKSHLGFGNEKTFLCEVTVDGQLTPRNSRNCKYLNYKVTLIDTSVRKCI